VVGIDSVTSVFTLAERTAYRVLLTCGCVYWEYRPIDGVAIRDWLRSSVVTRRMSRCRGLEPFSSLQLGVTTQRHRVRTRVVRTLDESRFVAVACVLLPGHRI
jgi:hypothetical protein